MSTELARHRLPVSVVSTVKNEATSLERFWASLVDQFYLPSEVVIVDGGSTDGTVELLKKLAEKAPFPVRIEIARGVGIAEGMNLAVRLARYEVIACTHAGCRPERDWLEEIAGPLMRDSGIDAVAGWFQPWAETGLERLVGLLTCGRVDDVDTRSFLPSSRSLAFRRHVWFKLGGFPEWLQPAGEDTYFSLALRKSGFSVAFAPKAIVYWRQRGTLRGIVRQFFAYARADGIAGFSQSRRGLFMKYILAALLLLGGLEWKWSWSILLIGTLVDAVRFMWRRRTFALAVLPLRYCLDLVQLGGFMVGAVERRKRPAGMVRVNP